MKLSFTFGKREFGLSIGRTSPDVAAFTQGTDVDDSHSSGAGLVHPYAQSAWVYIAVSVLAQNVAQIPFRICQIPASAQNTLAQLKPRQRLSYERLRRTNYAVFKKRVMMENIVESGPAVDLFENPHPSMPRALFWETVMTWQSLRGEFFILPMDQSDQPLSIEGGAGLLGRSAGKVKRMITLDPVLFWHMVIGYDLSAWRYTGSPLLTPVPSEILEPSQVVHSRMPNPFLYWRGMSPLEVAKVTAQSDYAAEQFMKGLMMNNADTGVIVTTDQQVSKEQREAIMAALRERKRKAGTPDRPLFLWGGAQLGKPQISSADMQFLETRNMNRKEILAIFSVPEALVGFSDRKESLGGGGGAQQERFAFAENTLAPHCTRLEDAVRPIIKTFGADLDGFFDIDSLPIMQEARRGRLDAAVKAFGMGVPVNQINQLYDLGFQDIDGGDIGYLPFSLQPIETVANPDPNAPGPGGQPGSGPDQISNPSDPNQNHLLKLSNFLSSLQSPISDHQRLLAVKNPPHVCAPNPEYEAALAPRVKQLRSKLSRFWFEQRSRILAKLPEVMKQFALIERFSSGETVIEAHWKWTADRTSLSRGLDDLFSHKTENEKLLRALKPLLLSSVTAGGQQLWKEIGASKSISDHQRLLAVKSDFALSPAAAAEYLSKAEKLISDINQTTWDRLRASLQEGLQSGDSMEALADRVKTFFAGQDARGDTIALTETNRATNAGRQEGMREANVERKGWKTSHLENTRPTHLANEALSDAENGIPLDDEWPNGCQYPGDPDAEASETINCKCFGYAILTGGNP